MKKNMIWLIVLSIILIDQLSKQWILQLFVPYQPKAIAPMFDLMLAFNTGAAFSLLSNTGAWHHWFFLGFGVLMSVVIAIWMMRLPVNATLQRIGLALILGGALGNLIDRIWLGQVIDFIQVYYKTHYWPVFNLADSAICVGAALIAIEALWQYHKTVNRH